MPLPGTRLAGTDLRTTRLGFGTSSLHHLASAPRRRELLEAALDLGFRHFDTARSYGEGMAERTLGEVLGGDLRQGVTIATKFGIPARPLLERHPGLLYGQRVLVRALRQCGWKEGALERQLTPAAAERSLARSLQALRTDWVDILFVHEPRIEEAALLHRLGEWLLRQKSAGRVRYLGLAGEARSCVAVAREVTGLFDVLQVEDSLDRREADAVTAGGLPLQITFGYLRNWRARGAPGEAEAVLRQALGRNRRGVVLVSARSAPRLAQLASVASQEPEVD